MSIVPTPRQQLFLGCPVFEVLFGGGLGGGKSFVLVADTPINIVPWAHKQWLETGRPSRGVSLIVRREYKRLTDMISLAKDLYPLFDPAAPGWRENDKSFYFSCGYKVEFGHLEGPQDHEQYQGREFVAIYVDQAEELPEHQVEYIKGRVRTSDDALRPLRRVRLSANPYGRFVHWVKKRFVQGAPPESVVRETVVTSTGEAVQQDRVFIPSLLRDNPHLGPEYEATLLKLPDHLRRALLEGDWNVVVGSHFADVWDHRKHVVGSFTAENIPRHWVVERSADWGTRAPACCLWSVVDNDGNLIVLDELYGPADDYKSWGKLILERERSWGWTVKRNGVEESKLDGWIDGGSDADYGSGGPTPYWGLNQMGVRFWKTEKGREAAATEVRRLLSVRDKNGRPGLMISNRCVDLIRTLPVLISDDKEPDKVAKSQEDHAYDALCYRILNWPAAKYGREEDKRRDEDAAWEKESSTRRRDDGRNPVTGY